MPKKWKSKLCRLIFVSILVICFCIHVRDSVTKFLEGQTTMALLSETHASVGPPPSISFCPGFKPQAYEAQNQYEKVLKSWNGKLFQDLYSIKVTVAFLKHFFYVYVGTATEEDIQSWWRNMTFDFHEILPSIAYPGYPDTIVFPDSPVPGTFNLSQGARVTIKEVSTFEGRCYTIDFDTKLRHEEYFTLNFNLSQSYGRLVVFAHEKHNEVGLHDGYWPVKPLAIPLREHDEASIIFHRSYIAKLDEKMCVTSESYSYPRCVLDWSRQQYSRLGDYNTTGNM